MLQWQTLEITPRKKNKNSKFDHNYIVFEQDFYGSAYRVKVKSWNNAAASVCPDNLKISIFLLHYSYVQSHANVQ